MWWGWLAGSAGGVPPVRPQTAVLGGVCGNSGWCSPRRRPCVEEGRSMRGGPILGQEGNVVSTPEGQCFSTS